MRSATSVRLSLLSALVAVLAPRAAGAEQPVLVLEFAGEPAASAAELSKEMAEAVRASGSAVNQASREDVLTLAGCGEASDDCLRQALGIVEAREVVTGEVRAAGSGVEVELRAVAAEGETRTRTVALAGATPAEQRAQFRPEAAAFWKGEPSPAAAAAAAAAAPPEPPPGADLSRREEDSGFSAGRVKPWAWGVAGGGVGLVAVGALFLVAAEGKQGEVDDAPTETVEDLEALADLEESGRRYARWGNVCVIVGGIAAIAGGVLVYRQGTDGGEESAAPQVTIAPSAGSGLGAALLVRGAF